MSGTACPAQHGHGTRVRLIFRKPSSTAKARPGASPWRGAAMRIQPARHGPPTARAASVSSRMPNTTASIMAVEPYPPWRPDTPRPPHTAVRVPDQPISAATTAAGPAQTDTVSTGYQAHRPSPGDRYTHLARGRTRVAPPPARPTPAHPPRSRHRLRVVGVQRGAQRLGLRGRHLPHETHKHLPRITAAVQPGPHQPRPVLVPGYHRHVTERSPRPLPPQPPLLEQMVDPPLTPCCTPTAAQDAARRAPPAPWWPSRRP